MRYSLYFCLQICAVIALVVAVALHASWLVIALVAAVAIAMFILAYRAVAIPLRTVQNGLYLLQEQDFTSRLRAVGQTDADKVVKLFNDLMATMKAERLKNLEQNYFLHKLIEASPMGIAICDYDGNIKETNPAYDAVNTPELSALLRELSDGESRVVRAAQSQILRCSRQYFMDEGFRRPFYLVERLTDEILKAETAIFNKIVRTMGHEVNNTLGSVTSVLQTLEDMHGDDEFIASTVRSSIDSCNFLGQFVKGYSDVVKLPEPELVHTDLNALVADALPGLQHLANNKITITASCSPQPVYVNVDAMLFERVMVNIVKNAVESIGDSNGSIVISVEDKALKIIDNGRGIKPDDAQKLFTPFFSTKHQDRGLGLMLIADILRKHHAEFSLATDTSGLTTFAITFPR